MIARALPPSAVAGALIIAGHVTAGALVAGVTVLAVVVAEWHSDPERRRARAVRRHRRRAHRRNDRLR